MESTMDENTLKLKRQVRDHYNKSVNDEDTIKQVADVIGYEREVKKDESD
jgi:hypothetical protein